MNKNFFLTLALAIAAPAFANAEVEIKDATVNGDGCPVGTATVIVTNSTPGGPVDFALVSFDSFRVENTAAGVAKLYKKTCKLVLDVFLPAGHTLGTMQFANEGYTDRGEKDTKMLLDTNLHVSELNSSQPLRRYPFALMSRSSIEGDFDYMFPVYDIGDTYADTCDRGIVVTMEVEFVLTLKTSRRSTANAMARVDKASVFIPAVAGSNAAPCQDAPNYPWWWGW